jgi:hypothetical protein
MIFSFKSALHQTQAVGVSEETLVPVSHLKRFPGNNSIHIRQGEPSELNIKENQAILSQANF